MRAAGFLIGGVVVVATIAVVLATRSASDDIAKLRAESADVTAALDETRDEKERLETELAAEHRRTQRAEAEKAAALAETETLQEAVARLEKELAEAAAVIAEHSPPVPDDWHEVVKSFPAYSPEGLGDALATVDWDVVAESMSNMPPLIAELATHLAEGRPMNELPAETIGSIQRYNGPLLTTAMKLSQKGVAGSDVNGAFSHPGFMSNALAATLLALDMPLSKEQSTKLDRITADYSAREAKRVDGYDDDTYIVKRLVDESLLKHDFFAEVYKLLTDEQHVALRPEAVRGRLQLDIFCESLAWAGKAGPLVFDDREDLTNKAGSWVISRGAIPDAAQEQTRGLVAQWVDELPDEFLAWEADGLANMGMLHVEHTTDSAAHVLELLRTMDRELDLDAAQRARLRQVPGSIVPYRQASGS